MIKHARLNVTDLPMRPLKPRAEPLTTLFSIFPPHC